MVTGDIEILASRLEFLSRSDTPPFVVEDRTNATEELRLEYRYLDLRRPAMQKNLMLRDEIAFRVRRVLHATSPWRPRPRRKQSPLTRWKRIPRSWRWLACPMPPNSKSWTPQPMAARL